MLHKSKKLKYEREVKPKFGKDLDFASTEAYKLLRTNLSFSMPDKAGAKIIGITSPCPQEGKSTTSLNLAYSIAEAGHTVILVDADMRRPSLAKTLNMEMSPGLSNVLAEDAKDAIHEKVLNDKLSVLFSGDVPPNPSELVASEKMKQLMLDMASKYEYVIVDMPPVISVSDPLAMSKNIDGVVMVVRHGYSKRKDVLEAIRQLKMVNVRILGFVYNGVYKNKKFR